MSITPACDISVTSLLILDRDKENTIPPTPFSNGGRAGEVRAVSDNPELAAIAKRVVQHYRAKVRTAHPNGGAMVLVMNHLAAGIDEADLRRRCDRYAVQCDRLETPLAKRQGAGTFFGPNGHHTSFDDSSASDDSAAASTAPPPLPIGPKRDRTAANGPRIASSASGRVG